MTIIRKTIVTLFVFTAGAIISYKGLEIIGNTKQYNKEVLSDNIETPIENDETLLLSATSSTPIPTLIPSIIPTIAQNPAKTPTQTPTPLPTLMPEAVHGFIDRFSAQYGVDPNVLRHIAVCESGFNSYAVNGKYVGLFQFSVNTWKSNRIKMGEDEDPNLRLNPEESAQTASYMVSIGRGDIWPNCFP